MKSKDQVLLEEAYKLTIAQQRIKTYIEGGSKGDLQLDHLKSNVVLPDNFTVNGMLDLSYTKIQALPKNLRVRSHLDLKTTKITSLPEDIQVGGTLNLMFTKITHLPDNLTIPRHLEISYCWELEQFPKNLNIGGNLYMSDVKIELKDIKYPIEVGGMVFAHGNFTDEEFKEHNDNLKKYRELKKELPELEGIF